MLLSRQRSQKCREIIWETFKRKKINRTEQRCGVSVRSRLLSHKYMLFKKKNGPRYNFAIDDPNEKNIQETKWL
jgi:hypothetical protein